MTRLSNEMARTSAIIMRAKKTHAKIAPLMATIATTSSSSTAQSHPSEPPSTRSFKSERPSVEESCSSEAASVSKRNAFPRDAIESALMKSASEMGYPSVKPQQREAILSFVSGKDVFVSLPTGYGKSLCFGCLPLIFKELRKEQCIVIVVSPLIALMKDQVKSFTSKGISAAVVDADTESEVLKGNYELVYISPESLISNHKFRCMCRSPIYKDRLVAMIVDEAHCVKKW